MVAVVLAAKLPPSLVAILPPTLVAIVPRTLVAILPPTLVAILPPILVAILPPTPAAMSLTTTTIALMTLKIRSNFPSLLARGRRRPRLDFRPARPPPTPVPDTFLRDRKRQRRRRQSSRRSDSPVRATRWNASGCPAPQLFPTSKCRQLILIFYPYYKYRVVR
jgi:hypothetical protein